MFSPGYDEDVNAEIHVLNAMLRRAFVAQYEGRELLFAMSLESARWDAALKDIKRKRLPRSSWIAIICKAIEVGIVTREYVIARFPLMEDELKLKEQSKSAQLGN